MKKQVQLILVTLFLFLKSLTAFGQTNVGEVFTFEGFRCRITSTTPASFGGPIFGIFVDGTVEIIGLAENSKPHGFPGVTITVTVHNNHNDHIYYVNRIADNAFDATGKPGTEKLTSVLIPGNVTSIGSQAFAYNQLESVTIPGGVTHIGEAAFQGNQLTHMTIPGSVTSIGNYAFQANRLTHVTIPGSVTSIGFLAFQANPIVFASVLATTPPSLAGSPGDAFSNRGNITVLVPPGSVTAYENHADWTGFKSIAEWQEIDDDFTVDGITYQVIGIGPLEVEAHDYDGSMGRDVIIPETVDNENNTTYTVTSIGVYAFHANQLTHVTIPGSVNSIGNYAFQGNQLTRVTIPGSVTSIGFFAFQRNPIAFASVLATTPPSLAGSPGDAFSNRGNITVLVPPGSVTAYENHADWTGFGPISELPEVGHEFTVDGITYQVIGPLEVETHDYDGSMGRDVIIPETVSDQGQGVAYTVTAIGQDAFREKELTEVNIPGEVTAIGDSAFARNKLPRIYIPNKVTSIGSHAFAYNELSEVNIPGSVTSIGEAAFAVNKLDSVIIPSSVTSIPNYAFHRNQLTSVTLPNTLTRIGTHAFHTNQLTSVTLPNSLKTIGNSAFWDNDLTEVTLPGNVTRIDQWAFWDNLNLAMVTVKADSPPILDSAAFKNRGQIDLVVPGGKKDLYLSSSDWTGFKSTTEVAQVDDEFIDDHITYRITEITPNRKIAAIDYNTTGGHTVSIPDTVQYQDIDYAVTAIGNNAFNGKELTGVTIGENVTHIGSGAFWDNELASVTIPGTVTRIELNAFRDNKLGSVVIPGGVTKIGTFAFRSNQLDSVTLGANVDHIDFGAFRFNELTSVIIPSSVTNIGEEALANNPITKVTVQATVPPGIQDKTFTNRSQIDVIVPRGRRQAYLEDNGWTGFKNIIDAQIGDTFIADDITYEIA